MIKHTRMIEVVMREPESEEECIDVACVNCVFDDGAEICTKWRPI